jgi:hypothetical protein
MLTLLRLISITSVACAWSAISLNMALAQFATPEAAIQAIYAQYQGKSSNKGPSLLSLRLDEATARRFFEPGLAKAWLKDLAKASEGENVIDSDPFTGGQDEKKISGLSIGPSQITGDRATVEVRLRNFNKPVRFIYRLKHDADGWRIYDVATGGAQGLRRDLGLRD